MADMKEIVKLAIDAYKGHVEKYSVGQSQEALRQALVEANGGSTKLDYKAIRDGKYKVPKDKALDGGARFETTTAPSEQDGEDDGDLPF